MAEKTLTCSVTLHRRFDAVRASARGALDGEAQPGPFDRLDWFEALHASAFAGQTPLIAEARAGAAAAWLFLSASPGKDGLVSLANWYSFVARPQFAGGEAGQDPEELLIPLASALKREASHIRLYPVVDEPGGSLARLRAAFGRAGWRVVARKMARKRVLRLAPGTRFADYWAQRPGALRATIARKTARFPLDITIHRQIDDAVWAAFTQVFAQSWKPAGDDFAFLRHFAQREAASGRLRLGLARLDGEPAAVELWSVDQGHAYIHKLAYVERLGPASPGSRLSHALFAHAIEVDRVSVIDFGTGDNAYKAAWMPDALPMWQLDLFHLGRLAVWPGALRATLSALRPGAPQAKPGRPRAAPVADSATG